MSVINSMLRDLDRRHAPSPFKGNAAIGANVQAASAQSNRVTPRSALVLCVLIALVILSWGHQSTQNYEKTANQSPLPPGEGKGEGSQLIEAPATSIAPSPALENELVNQNIVKIKPEEKISLTPTPLPKGEGKTAHETQAAVLETPAQELQVQPEILEPHKAAPIIKQERNSADDIDAERYQLARNALAQNQPQRAYELLRDNPPALASNTDYHAVLAAVEQQLGHYADASLRYQQLLMVDQNQASWWLGLALSFDGAHRNSDALAAYRRATQLNSLPEAAHQYAKARIAALNRSAEQ